jgi:3-deoxy-D-manno-octulosonic-acid transferase
MTSAPRRTLLLSLYLLVSRHVGRLARRKLRERLRQGKEDPQRINERMGQAVVPRPVGRLVWFHAASVGEGLSLLELLKRLKEDHPEINCLVTSGTLTSASILGTRMPDGCIHQFVPLDVLPWIERFLDHWRPDVAIWTESELWPAAICEARRRNIPMLLINARISLSTFRRWLRLRGTATVLLRRFDRILAQDELAGEQLSRLGADPETLSVSGSLKEGASPLPHDEHELARFRTLLGNRPVWLAASTHLGEEDQVLSAHRMAVRSVPGLLLILVPRHPERGAELAAAIEGAGLRLARRSREEDLGEETEVYLADTLGELGVWYRLAPVCFVGGSLIEIGGHNPYEPALLGSAILHGPHVRNFSDAYARLSAAEAAIEVRGGADFGRSLVAVLSPDRAASMAAAAWDVCSKNAEITDTVEAEIVRLLGKAR